MGDISGEYAGYAGTGMFSASRNCVKIVYKLYSIVLTSIIILQY